MFDITSRARTDVRVMNGHRGHSVFYGVAFSPDGRRAWASGGGQDVLHAYSVTQAGRFVPETGRSRRAIFPPGSPTGARRSATACTSRTTSAAIRSPRGRTRTRPATR